MSTGPGIFFFFSNFSLLLSLSCHLFLFSLHALLFFKCSSITFNHFHHTSYFSILILFRILFSSFSSSLLPSNFLSIHPKPVAVPPFFMHLSALYFQFLLPPLPGNCSLTTCFYSSSSRSLSCVSHVKGKSSTKKQHFAGKALRH